MKIDSNELVKRIELLMTENEIIKSNALKAITTSTGSADRCAEMYSTAKKENAAYQNVLTLIKQLENES